MTRAIRSFRRAARVIGAAGVALIAVITSACFKGQPGVGNSAERVTLLVSNRGYFDVNIYALRSTVVSGRRLGTVTGNSSTTLMVPVTELQPGGQLALMVRAIGSRSSWMSPMVALGPGVVARLDVYSTSSGDLSQSQLFTQPALRPDSSEGPRDGARDGVRDNARLNVAARPTSP